MNKKSQSTLIGMFFHAIDNNNEIQWRGHIVDEPHPGWYLVNLFDWLLGEEEGCTRLVKISDMEKWMFYKNKEEMAYSGKYGAASGVLPQIPAFN